MKWFSDASFRTDWLVMPNKDIQGYSCFYFVGLLTIGGCPHAKMGSIKDRNGMDLKTLREIFHSLLNLMGGINKWKEKSEKGTWCGLQSPYLLDYALLRRPPARGAQATSCFFPGSRYSGKFWFLACSGDQEPLVIYALTYPSFPL